MADWRAERIEELSQSRAQYAEPWGKQGERFGQAWALGIGDWGSLVRLMMDEARQQQVIEPFYRLFMVSPDFDATARDEFATGFVAGVMAVMDTVPAPVDGTSG